MQPARDEPSNSPTVARPRFQLSDLPTELKDKIAQQCHAADVRLRKYIDAPERVGDSSATNLRNVQISRGRSIGSLYAVSKEWKNICVPYRFEVCSVTA